MATTIDLVSGGRFDLGIGAGWYEAEFDAFGYDFATLGERFSILEESVARFPGKFALDFMGRRITFRELGDLTDRAAAGFQELGVQPGVHVGLFLPNTPHYVIAFFGVAVQ